MRLARSIALQITQNDKNAIKHKPQHDISRRVVPIEQNGFDLKCVLHLPSPAGPWREEGAGITAISAFAFNQ